MTEAVRSDCKKIERIAGEDTNITRKYEANKKQSQNNNKIIIITQRLATLLSTIQWEVRHTELLTQIMSKINISFRFANFKYKQI